MGPDSEPQIVSATPLLLYIIASTGRTRTVLLYWHPILQIVLDALLLPVWFIPVLGTTVYDCKSICTSCQAALPAKRWNFHAWVGQLTCSCVASISKDAESIGRKAITISRKTTLRPGRGDPTTKVFAGAKRIPIVQYAQVAMVYVLLCCQRHFLRDLDLLNL